MTSLSGESGLLYFDDLTVGRRFRSGRMTVDAAEIVAFARQFDPQPFHLDDAAAQGSMFKGLAASGWHTLAMTMRLIVDSLPVAGGVIGSGADGLRWLRPVRPGDELWVEMEVMGSTPSKSRPQGRVDMRNTTRDAAGEAVQEFTAHMVVPRRVSGGSG